MLLLFTKAVDEKHKSEFSLRAKANVFEICGIFFIFFYILEMPSHIRSVHTGMI